MIGQTKTGDNVTIVSSSWHHDQLQTFQSHAKMLTSNPVGQACLYICPAVISLESTSSPVTMHLILLLSALDP